MELEWKDYKYKDKKLSFTIRGKEINGICGNHLEDIIEVIRLIPPERKNIYVSRLEIREDQVYEIKKKISFVPKKMENSSYPSVVEEMIDYIKQNEVYPKNLMKKLKDSVKIVGLEESVLARNMNTLSTSEKKLVQIAKELLLNPEILILEEPLKVLDMKNRKKLMMVLRKIKDQGNRTIVMVSNDPEDLYKETDHLIVYKNNQIVVEGKTTDVYQRVDFLKKHKVEIPEIVEFTYLAKKNKKVKLDYFRDIRDIIKDIYKHV